jgi:hypothetical protein
VINELLKSFKNGNVGDGCGCLILYDALFNAWYRVVFSRIKMNETLGIL